jgi:Na+/H+-dicarboxylate symporter
MRKAVKANLLTILILIALVLGATVGEVFLFSPDATDEKLEELTRPWRTIGELVLLRPLFLVITPLIFTSVLTGVTSIGEPKKLGVLGGATLLFYVVSMLIAVVTGVTLAAVFQPGAGVEGLAQEAAAIATNVREIEGGLSSAWLQLLYAIVPNNFFSAVVNGETLSLITATIVLGVALTFLGEKARPFLAVVESLHEALMLIVRWLLWLLPLGVFFLVAWAVGKMGLSQLFDSLKAYVFVVVGGLLIHSLVWLPGMLWLLGRVNPYRFMWAVRQPLLMAFGSASSIATLPVTIESCVERGGCSRRASGLVLPLGATVNMDGTALYQGVCVIFLFQVFGIELHFTQYLIIVLAAILSAIGAAGVPGAGLATTIIVINAVNTSLASIPGVSPLPPAALGLIIGVDRVLDMCRTTVNVFGDMVVARIITRMAPDEPHPDKEIAYG